MVDDAGHRRTIVDTVADNAADAGLVTGAGRLDPAQFRPRDIGGELWINGVIEETGLGTAVLGDPARSVAWLANTLATYGEGLEAGQIVLSGSLIQSIPVSAGDEVRGDFGDLGVVSCRFH
jgi:2-oxo-hept-3-ene-1,7-dioate hydratase